MYSEINGGPKKRQFQIFKAQSKLEVVQISGVLVYNHETA